MSMRGRVIQFLLRCVSSRHEHSVSSSPESERRVSGGGSVVQESLPFPIVHYPPKNGVFAAFARDYESPPVFCSCCEDAIKNYLLFRRSLGHSLVWELSDPSYGSGRRRECLGANDTHFFPEAWLRSLRRVTDVAQFPFGIGLCHRCNKAVPAVMYSHRDFVGGFGSFYGWYVNQKYLALGIFPHGLGVHPGRHTFFSYLPGVHRAELSPMVLEQQEVQRLYMVKHQQILAGHGYSARDCQAFGTYRSQAHHAAGSLNRAVENLVRAELGVSKIGEQWIGETTLFYLVRHMFAGEKVVRHAFPSWVEGLELDIFLPESRIAFEYQGQQHYKPVRAWGGQAAFEALRERDRRKYEICRREGVRLVYVSYSDPLSEDHIRRLLNTPDGRFFAD